LDNPSGSHLTTFLKCRTWPFGAFSGIRERPNFFSRTKDSPIDIEATKIDAVFMEDEDHPIALQSDALLFAEQVEKRKKYKD